jgi:nitric oxide reductase activation protein
MSLHNIMLRLGEVFSGTNMELCPLREDSSEGGTSDAEDSESEDSESEDSESEDSESEDSESEDSESEDSESEDSESEDSESEDSESGATSEDEDSESAEDEDSASGSDSGDDEEEGGDEEDGDEGGGNAAASAEASDSGSEEEDAAASEEEDEYGDDSYDDEEDADEEEDTEGGDSAGGDGPDLDKEEEFHSSLNSDLSRDLNSLLDNNEALASVVNQHRDTDCAEDEKVWRPFNPDLDRIVRPRGDKRIASSYRNQVKPLTAAIRAEFRARFLQARKPLVRHGVRRGKDLSERRLVESFVEIRSGIRPSRPDYRIDKKPDVSLALAVVGDESGSMGGKPCQYAAMAMMSIAEAFDSLGSPVMCCGVRNGDHCYMDREEKVSLDRTLYHRYRGVRVDLFKDWDETFQKNHDRFASYTATGNTPLSDGIQFAMQELGQRPEKFRVILVLTDGMPNRPKVVRRQVRLAREAGVFVVGIGIDGAGSSVKALFPEYNIDVPTLSALPKEMFSVLSSIMFPTRGTRARFEGSFRRSG